MAIPRFLSLLIFLALVGLLVTANAKPATRSPRGLQKSMSGQAQVDKAWLRAKWSKVAGRGARADVERHSAPKVGLDLRTNATLKSGNFEKTTLDGAKDVSQAKILRFKEWKDQKVQDAMIRYNALRSERERTSSEGGGGDPNLKKKGIEAQSKDLNQVLMLEAQLRAQETTIEILKDLTVVDYTVGYLSKFQDRPVVVQDFVASLNQEQAVELVSAYLESLKRSDTTTTADNN